MFSGMASASLFHTLVNGTSNLRPLTLLVIGHIKAREVSRLNGSGETTKAGRKPACSLPS